MTGSHYEFPSGALRKFGPPRVVLSTVPACYLLKNVDGTLETSEKVHDAYTEALVLGPEESVSYDFQEGGYVYGAPFGDPSDTNHPKDQDGNLMRRRSKILSRMPA